MTCEKVRHKNKSAAVYAARLNGGQAYFCSYCKAFHSGHSDKFDRDERKQALNYKAWKAPEIFEMENDE